MRLTKLIMAETIKKSIKYKYRDKYQMKGSDKYISKIIYYIYLLTDKQIDAKIAKKKEHKKIPIKQYKTTNSTISGR